MAVTAGAAAASFLLLRDNADQAGVSLDDLHKPVQQLREEFAKLNRDQREASLVKWQQEQINATDKVKGSLRHAVPVDPLGDGYGAGADSMGSIPSSCATTSR